MSPHRRRIAQLLALLLLLPHGGAAARPSLAAPELDASPLTGAGGWRTAISTVPGAGPGTVWRIRGERGTVFLVGSLHLLRRDGPALPQALERAYARAGRVVLEVNLEAVDATALATALLQRGTLLDGRTLPALVGPALWPPLRQQLEGLGVPEPVAERLAPWAASLLLGTGALLRGGFDPASGVEGRLLDWAKRDRKPIDGLESPSAQIDLLASLPPDDQLALLRQVLRESDGGAARLAAVEAAWRQGDLRRLEGLLLEEVRRRPDLHERLVIRRNLAWLPRIRDYLDRPGDTLVVVGLLHLLGRGGILEGLSRQGLAVERIDGPPPAGPAPGGR